MHRFYAYKDFDLDEYEKHYDVECKHCLEKEQVMDDAHDFLEDIVKQLYMTEPLDKNHLEHCLDELCFLLKVKMNTNDLNIERVAPKTQAYTTNWREFNKKHLQSLTK